MSKEYLAGQMDFSDVPGFDYYSPDAYALTPLQMVYDFAEVMGQLVDATKGQPSSHWSTEVLEDEFMREELIREEYKEFMEASQQEFADTSSVDVLKELADLVYVVYGYAAFRGWDLDEAVQRVHANNMDRCIWPDGSIRKREDGKVLKNPNAPRVDLSDLVEKVP